MEIKEAITDAIKSGEPLRYKQVLLIQLSAIDYHKLGSEIGYDDKGGVTFDGYVIQIDPSLAKGQLLVFFNPVKDIDVSNLKEGDYIDSNLEIKNLKDL